MNKIHLKGRLGIEFGPLWELEIKTPKEALHAINMNTEGRFLRYIEDSVKNRGVSYVFQVGDYVVDSPDKLVLIEGPCGSEDIYVTPVVGGGAPAIPYLIYLVISIVVAVVSAMLAPSPNIDLGSNNDTARKDSYLFSGGPQPAKQGKPVPVGYGRMLVYPIAISVQYEYSSKGFGNTPADFQPNNYNDWGSSGGYYNQDNKPVLIRHLF